MGNRIEYSEQYKFLVSLLYKVSITQGLRYINMQLACQNVNHPTNDTAQKFSANANIYIHTYYIYKLYMYIHIPTKYQIYRL